MKEAMVARLKELEERIKALESRLEHARYERDELKKILEQDSDE